MNPSFLKKLSLLLASLTLLNTAAWAKDRPLQTIQPDRFQFEAKHKYTVEVKSGQPIKAKGGQLQFHGRDLTLQDAKTGQIRRYNVDDIVLIKEKTGNHALLGLGIGAAAGGALLTGVALAENCDGSSDPGDCKAMDAWALAIGVPSGIVLGGLIGLGIGAALKKENKMVISPVVSLHQDHQTYGLGVSRAF